MARILIIEDEANLRFLLATALSDIYEVLEAENGEQGWQMFERYQPDLIITDLRMPGKNGNNLLREIRSTGSNVKIMVLSALLEKETTSKKEADLYLAKPAGLPVIKKAISDLLNG